MNAQNNSTEKVCGWETRRLGPCVGVRRALEAGTQAMGEKVRETDTGRGREGGGRASEHACPAGGAPGAGPSLEGL